MSKETVNKQNKVRKLVGYKIIPMQSHQVDGEVRCQYCWLKGATTPRPGKKGDHFCRWNIENQGERNPNPQPYKQPIYQWVSK